MVNRLRASATMHFKIPVEERTESLWNISILFLSLGGSHVVFTAIGWVLSLLQRCGAHVNLLSFWTFSLLLLLGLLVLSLKVVLGQVAVLAHTAGVVRLVRVTTSVSHLGLSLSMVAVVAHVLGVVLPVGMRALEDFSPLPLTLGAIMSFVIFGFFLKILSHLAINWGKLIDWFLDVKLNSLRLIFFSLIVHLTKLG